MNQYYYQTSSVEKAQESSRFMTRVYQWMAIGVLLTGLIASFLGTNEALIMQIMANRALFWVMVIAQFGLVIGISGFINRLSAITATAMFLAYSALTGVTLSTIFLIYTASSIHSAFFTTSIGFAGLSLWGITTKKDLGPIGSFCTMGLFGMVGYSLLAIFFPSMMGGTAGLVYSLLGLVVFSGLTAYNTQKIKHMGLYLTSDSERSKASILGALTLYLDFINLFIMILRLTGDRRR